MKRSKTRNELNKLSERALKALNKKKDDEDPVECTGRLD